MASKEFSLIVYEIHHKSEVLNSILSTLKKKKGSSQWLTSVCNPSYSGGDIRRNAVQGQQQGSG
jgi:hypothetical protein